MIERSAKTGTSRLNLSNTLYLTYDGLNDPLGQSQILPYLIGLSEKGHNITVISFEKEEIQSHRSGNSNLKIIPLQYHKFPPVLSTIYDLFQLRKEVTRVLRSENIDVIHCRSYITSLIGLWAKRKYGVKFIFDMRGFWADERVEGRLWNLNNLIYRKVYGFFKRKEKSFVNSADAIISLTQNAKSEILGWGESLVKADKIAVIPTCADFQLINPGKTSTERTNELKSELRIQEHDFVLLYLGSLGTWYMLNEMLDFFIELKNQRQLAGEDHPFEKFDKVKFLFVSREREELERALKVKNIPTEDVVFTSCSRQEVPDYLSICHASIFFILPTFSKKASSATKMGEALAIGKPIITNTGWGDVDLLVKDENGVLVSEFSKKSYAAAIKKLCKNWPYNSDKIRNDAMKTLSLQNGVEKYNTIYADLMSDTT